MKARLSELSGQMSDPDIIADQSQFQKLSKEYAKLANIVTLYNTYSENVSALEESKNLLQDDDEQLRQLAQEEISQLQNDQVEVINQIHLALIPEDPDDHRNIFLEIIELRLA